MSDKQKLDEITRTALGLTKHADLSSIAYGKTAEWDSVAHLQLMAAIEDGFGISLGGDEVGSATDHAAICRVLSSHGLKLDQPE